MKKCSVCKIIKPLKEFYKNRSKPDSHGEKCAVCMKAYQKDLYWENPEESREYDAKQRKKHLTSIVAHNKEYRHQNKAKVAQWNQNRPLATKLMHGAKSRAKKRQIPFNLVPEDIFIPEICPVLGIKLIVNKGKCDFNSPTLDCIIPEKGYIPGNIAVISFKANTMKSNATLEELKSLVIWLEKQTVESRIITTVNECHTKWVAEGLITEKLRSSDGAPER